MVTEQKRRYWKNNEDTNMKFENDNKIFFSLNMELSVIKIDKVKTKAKTTIFNTNSNKISETGIFYDNYEGDITKEQYLSLSKDNSSMM